MSESNQVAGTNPVGDAKDGNSGGGQVQKAVALRYNPEKDDAPVVIASGYGPVAEKIIDIAEERGIPVYRDDSAASMLCMLGVGANIPSDLYEIVAAVYTQILRAASHIQSGEKGPLYPKAPRISKRAARAAEDAARTAQEEAQAQAGAAGHRWRMRPAEPPAQE